ncbi:MAG TPA: M3 family oligoendopeptidase [Solirubrobacteraceae bacterium]|nr:M3 family oligoendopeptidase [Solirubrobacteraceae bacterium]
MASSAETVADPEVEQVAWDLGPLVAGQGDAGVDRLLDDAADRAQRFAAAHAGRLAELDSGGLRAAMEELVAIQEAVARAGTYAALSFAVDTADAARGALMQRVEERGTAIETQLLFFDLEWAALPEERADELLSGEGLDFCRHHLRMQRRYRPHLLSEPEEKVLAEKSVSGRSAWARLFAEQASAIRVALPDEDEEIALEVALSRLASPDRDVRRSSAAGVTEALAPGLRTRGFILNTLFHDKAVDDRLRRYPHWLASRNLANEASDESVRALVEAVRGRYELARRWYRLKARMLGLDRLADYDRSAAVSDTEPTARWTEGRDLVLESYAAFSADLGGAARRFFDEPWIDAPVRPHKRGGAFCAYTVPGVHPYLMLNWTGRRRDVLTLAHELGHGVHAALAARQGLLHQHTPLTLAETASVFGETIVFGRLLEQADSPESRLSLLAESIEGSIATVFRQVAMHRFEDVAHTARREEGELAVERFGELWTQTQEEMFGDAVEVTPGYRTWWSYIPHFVNTPGYVYAYAYGQLLALSVYRRYRDEGEAFVPRYLELLGAGGSKPPEELLKVVGVDVIDPGFWDAGLDLVEEQLEAAESAAREAGRV